ncbi:hypothetical protein VOLCADRAFT_97893 [Volvox carteri f. nagariensis]|uniref:Aminotransferase class I/classII large domain-containing protein n=1 Tax=Volvox carteri f. nagariensis TaxID=3068 RepID=D8UDX6_VOLCA|nr:uncharacterized protein VOLCADRAFT_97893 [Volvox carteri f. nagariensis]EFJ42123.1 hypothetical protein VOLCADRAFT_97893 [Volvox carteri f. nagariensis]|eukprot:XP_002956820.1 hypothetical protein VOLCADRAFT_97893 [Volvox carteri f. nagariensis]
MPVTTSQKGDYVARQVGADCIDLSVGQPSPTLLPLQTLATAASHRLGSPDAELLLQYGPRQGYRSFRQSLSSFLSERYGVAVHPEHLMVTAGVSHGLALAVGRLSRPGDVIVVEQPTYFLVTPIFHDNHLTVVPVPTDEYGMVVEELESWLRKDPANRPRLVYTIPVHNNPRGTCMAPHRRRHLMRLAAEYDFYVLADEVYQAADAAAAVPGPLRCYESCDPRVSRVVSMGSFSKILAPALRLGWLESSNPAVMERLRGDGVISSGGCIAQLSTGLAHSALDLRLQRWIPGSLVEPLGGYFLWLELQEGIDSRQVLSVAERGHGVRFTPGPVCGGGAANCLRLAFSFYNEQTQRHVCMLQELEEGARRLGAAIREYMELQQDEQQKEQEQQQRQQFRSGV